MTTTYREVARVLGDLDVREVLAQFRAAGGDPDRWHREDRQRMCDLLTRTEDRLELKPGRSKGMALRDLRRRMEDELESPARRAA